MTTATTNMPRKITLKGKRRVKRGAGGIVFVRKANKNVGRIATYKADISPYVNLVEPSDVAK